MPLVRSRGRAGRPLLRTPRSLFWRVFLVDAALLVVAAAALVFRPAAVSFGVHPDRALVLVLGLAVILVLNGLVLHAGLKPLTELAAHMRRVDPLLAGRRLPPFGAREPRLLVDAYNDMLDRLERERRASSFRTVDREEDERRRLATELHDEVGQGLTALLLQLRSALDEAPDELVPSLLRVQELARDNLDEIRRIARHLRPTMLDDLGLGYAIHGLIDVVEETTDTRFVRRIQVDLPVPAPPSELAVYRVAQEALTNVMRHAAADRVEVVVSADEHWLLLEVHDDGRGMLYAPDHESGGIRGMRERAVAVGGMLGVRSRPGGGTSVTVSVPIAP